MELWFTEEHVKGVNFSIKVDKQLYTGSSAYQRIDVFESSEFGRILALDGFIMITEKDEFIYHEMMTHVPLAVNPEIKDVLVIGAGDGGTVRELTKYDSIEHIDMVELDEMVVDVCKEYFPQTACRFDDPRVNLIFQDGIRFVRNRKSSYDLIIVDSTDPFGPGEALFTREFYGNCYACLRDNGIMTCQLESAYYDSYVPEIKKAYKRLTDTFDLVKIYQAHIPTYPSGHWLFGFASKGFDPLKDLDACRWDALSMPMKYYNTELHKGCFALPNYVMEVLGI